jgi:hypothetical protein
VSDQDPKNEPTPPAQEPDGLAKKNQELLAEAKNAKAEARTLAAKLAEYEAEKAAREEAEAVKRGEFEKLLEKEKGEKATILQRYQAATIGNALKAALVDVKVAPAALEAAEALMRAKGATLGQDDAPMIDGKPLAEYVKSWAESDAGKFFVSAPNSSGGGAPGASGGGQTKTMARAAFEGLNPAEQMAAIRAGTTII